MSRFAVLVVWKDGEEEYVKQGLSNRVAVFPSRRRAQEMRDFMLEGMSDEVQSINIVEPATMTPDKLEIIRAFGDALTRRQLDVLRRMAEHPDDDEGELVRDRVDAFLGDDRVASRTVNALLRACAISQGAWGGAVERYRINETGRDILKLRGLLPLEGQR